MKTIAAVLLLSCWAMGQDKAAVSAAEAACGPQDVRFEVNSDESQHPAPAPEAGKALIYFLAEGTFTSVFAVDGTWVGAVDGATYSFISISPGEHHLCATWQKRILRFGVGRSLHALRAQPGETYYFATRLVWVNSGLVLELDQLDPDEGKAFVARAKFSTSHQK